MDTDGDLGSIFPSSQTKGSLAITWKPTFSLVSIAGEDKFCPLRGALCQAIHDRRRDAQERDMASCQPVSPQTKQQSLAFRRAKRRSDSACLNTKTASFPNAVPDEMRHGQNSPAGTICIPRDAIRQPCLAEWGLEQDRCGVPAPHLGTQEEGMRWVGRHEVGCYLAGERKLMSPEQQTQMPTGLSGADAYSMPATLLAAMSGKCSSDCFLAFSL